MKTVKTDRDGRFLIEGLPAGVYNLEFAIDISKPKYFFDGGTSIVLAQGQQKTVTVKAVNPVLLKGRVFHNDTAKPFARVDVALAYDDNAIDHRAIAGAETDDDGHFSVLSPPGKMSVTPWTGFHALQASVLVDVKPAAQNYIELRAIVSDDPKRRKTTHLEGVVLFPNGQPAGGAMVQIIDDDPLEVITPLTVHTDNRGRFNVQAKFAKAVKISAVEGPYATDGWQSLARNSTIKLQLKPNQVGIIKGAVYDLNNKPADDVTVSLNYLMGRFAFSLGHTKTDIEGRFTFDGLVPGSYSIGPLNSSYPDFEAATNLKAGETKELSCSYFEPLPAVVEGVVENAEGRPLMDAIVNSGTDLNSMVTDATGRFRIVRSNPLLRSRLVVEYQGQTQAFAYSKSGVYRFTRKSEARIN